MFQTTLDLLDFIKSLSPFLFSLVIYTVLAIALSKSIKKHAKVYYWVVGTLCLSFAIPVIAMAFGLKLPSVMSIPVIGAISGEWSNAATFLHPVLVIIMYMGAFSPKNKYIGRLMTIRKELSILTGFPFFAHIAKRLFHSFPKSWNFFMNYEESIASPRVTSVVGTTIEQSVLVLGVVMTALFLVLWITSFDSVRRKMGGKKWKSWQRWSYALYAMLFIHSVGLQVGGLMSYNAAQAKMEAKAKTEVVAAHAKTEAVAQAAHSDKKAAAPEAKKGETKAAPAKAQSGHGHGPKRFSFADVSVPRNCRALINIIIYILVYGSYLYFRLGKAKADKIKRMR